MPVVDCDPNTYEAYYTLEGLYTDPDKDNLRFDWYIDGEFRYSEEVEYSTNGMRSLFDVEFNQEGEYEIELQVTDLFPQDQYYDQQITVSKNWTLILLPEDLNNLAPTAVSNTLDTKEIPHDGDPNTQDVIVNLEVIGEDQNGDTLTYQWFDQYENSISGNPSEDNNVFAYELNGVGEYSFYVEVCDCYNVCDIEDVIITINEEPNDAPLVVANNIIVQVEHDGDPNTNNYILSIEDLDGEVIEPENDPYISYWKYLNEQVIEDISLSCGNYMYDIGTDYSFTLFAEDSYDDSSEDNAVITVLCEPNDAPVPVSTTLNFVSPSESVSLIGDQSYDSDLDDFTCEWVQVGGDIDVSINNQFNCNASIFTPDYYNEETMTDEELTTDYYLDFELKVTDSYGDYDVLDVNITVESPYENYSYVMDGLYAEQKKFLKSFSHLPNNTDLNQGVFEDATDNTSLNTVIGQSVASAYIDGLWEGSLNDIKEEDGYWFVFDDYNFQDFNIVGIKTSCEEVDYSMDYGVNLISYLGENGLAIEDAIPSEYNNNIISIIGASEAAQYNSNLNQWVGSLTNLYSDNGYWVRVDGAMNFDWNCDEGIAARQSIQNSTFDNLPEQFKFSQSMMQSFYFIGDIEISNDTITEEDWVVAYCGETVVGARQWSGSNTDIPVMGFDGDDYTIDYCQPNQEVVFKVFDVSLNDVLDLSSDTAIPAWQNLAIHNVSNLSSSSSMVPEDFSISNAYPNPFNPSTSIDFSVPVDSNVLIKIYDMQGRQVALLANQEYTVGYHTVTWNANEFSSGIYFVKMISENFTDTQKIMLIK